MCTFESIPHIFKSNMSTNPKKELKFLIYYLFLIVVCFSLDLANFFEYSDLIH